MNINIQNETCPICVNVYYKEGKKKKSDDNCMTDNCEEKCVFGSDMCVTHNRQRYPIVCLSCNKSCCRLCYITYFLNAEEDATKCIHCNKQFDIEYLLGEDEKHKQRFSSTFVWSDLKEHREKILVEQIMAKMPSYQRLAAAKNKADKYRERIIEIDNVIKVLKNERRETSTLLWEQDRIFNNVGNSEENKKENSFITRGKCPKELCNGYIEDKWECGICQTKVCSQCMVEKLEDHECEEHNIQSMKLIRDSTKPCPNCRTRIFKSEGCFAEGTEVLMYDGSIKLSQNIAIGDLLVGDDGNKRTVLELMSGADQMYEVIQNNGENYTVNEGHTLVLSDSLGNLCEIAVGEYLTFSEHKKSLLYGVKSSNGINYPEQAVEMDPYMLGLWLGDGTHTHPTIASNDIEIQTWILNWCKNNDCELTHEEGVKFLIRRQGNSNGKDTLKNPIGYSSCEECKGCKKKEQKICDYINEEVLIKREKRSQTNPFLEQLKKYSLIKNKHIPKEYLMNSREVRLKLLAGLIDTDGCVSNEGKRVLIVQTKVDLSEQIIFLARSLGFVVNYRIIERKNESIFGGEKKDYQNQYNINISGVGLSEIPTLLPRKKCENSNTNKNLFKTNIQVKSIGLGKYYGWKIDGNHRFISRKTFTILKNCSQMFCTNCHVFFCWNSGKLIEKTQYVHNPHFTEFQRQNGMLEYNRVLGGCIRVGAQTIYSLKISGLIENKLINYISKSNHILDHVQRFNDPVEKKNRDISIKFLNGIITKEELSINIQKFNKASRKEELTNIRRTTYANSIIDIITICHHEIHKNNSSDKKEELKQELELYESDLIEEEEELDESDLIEEEEELEETKVLSISEKINKIIQKLNKKSADTCIIRLQNLDDYTKKNMEVIGKLFKSNPPDVSMGFIERNERFHNRW
jgi:hypothetical protein